MAEESNDKPINLNEEAADLERIFSDTATYADRLDKPSPKQDEPLAAEPSKKPAASDIDEAAGDKSGSDEGSDSASSEAQAPAEDGPSTPKKKSKKKIIGIIVAIVVIILIAVGGFIVYNYSTGAIAPASAAAKYGTFEYLDESEVTDYIMTYKKQMGYENASDDEWASFLATYNLTPERLRLSTIYNLLTNKAMEKRAKELNITVTDDEVNAEVDAFKDAYAFNDDTVFENTLEMYGQTLEGFKETRRLAILEEKLLEQDMTITEPTTDEVRETIAEYAESCASDDGADSSDPNSGTFTIKHSYCFAMSASGDELSLDDYDKVELIKQEFVESGKTVDAFVTLVSLYCDVDEVKSVSGDMGWDAGTAEYSETYAKVLARTNVGEVSETFSDGNTECFIWVDQGYELPYYTPFILTGDLSDMPSSLQEYFTDLTLYNNRESMSEDYLTSLRQSLEVVIYPMPSDVPYNVDMSAYKVSEGE